MYMHSTNVKAMEKWFLENQESENNIFWHVAEILQL
jgi:hypothetical protein